MEKLPSAWSGLTGPSVLPPPDRSTIEVQQFSGGWAYRRPDGSWSKQLPLSTALVLRPWRAN